MTLSIFLALPALACAPQGTSTGTEPIATEPPKDAPNQVGLTWKDLLKSGKPFRFYGFLRLDAYYDTARMNNIFLPFTVSPEGAPIADDDDAGFALDPRLTRLGLDITPGEVGGADVLAKLEIDFANYPTGVSESRPTPRMRLGYIDVGWDTWGLRVGQDWDVISPIFPAANGETLMWNAGNTGDRRAQIQGRFAPKDSAFQVRASLGLTGAITNEDLDPTTAGTTPERDGFDSGLPHLQVRAGAKFDGFVEKKEIDLGLWGAVGQTETDTSFGNETTFDVSLAGVDLQVPISNAFALRGEAWTGENLGDFRGGIGQSINIVTGQEISAVGGWGEVAYTASDMTKFHLGATIDDPDDDDVPTAKPELNRTTYVGTVVDWKIGMRTGFDVILWETDWKDINDGDGLRFNLYFQYSF